jgi:hypothetical protein
MKLNLNILTKKKRKKKLQKKTRNNYHLESEVISMSRKTRKKIHNLKAVASHVP